MHVHLTGIGPSRHGSSRHRTAADRPVTPAVVQVAVPRPLRRVFDYSLPADLPRPRVGARVRVPFGRAEVVGIVTGFTGTSSHRLKPVISVLDSDGFLAPDLIALAQWLSGYYHHPPGRGLCDPAAERGAARARRPIRYGRSPGSRRRAMSPGWNGPPRQQEALEILRDLGAAVPEQELPALGIDRRTLRALAGKGPREVHGNQACVSRRAFADLAECGTAGGGGARSRASIGSRAIHLLDGVTGSGKTEVYMRVIARIIDNGGQVLVLVPEIGLTSANGRPLSPTIRSRGGTAFCRERQGATQHVDAMQIGGTQDPDRNAIGGIHPICQSSPDHCGRGTRHVVQATGGIALLGPRRRVQARAAPGDPGGARQRNAIAGDARQCRAGGVTRRSELSSRAGGARMPRFRVIDIRGRRLRDGLSDSLLQAVRRHLDAGKPGARLHQPAWVRAHLPVHHLRVAGALRRLRRAADAA